MTSNSSSRLLEFVAISLITAFFPALLNAELTLDSPLDKALITTVAPEMRVYLSLSQKERWAAFADLENRKKLSYLRAPVAQVFRRKVTQGESGPYVMEISEKEDFSLPAPVLILMHKEDPNANEAEIFNFALGKTYHWRVKGQKNGHPVVSPVQTFTTDREAPRLMYVPKVTNMRDLGGWIGKDGKRVRQGLIYRSIGLNENSPDRKREEGDPKTFAIGKPRITPEGIQYAWDGRPIWTCARLRKSAR